MPRTTRPDIPLDLRELLKIFNDHGVKYLIIGGVAYGYYAQPRYTKDLDLFVRCDAANAALVYRALAEFGIPLEDVSESDLINPKKFLHFGHEPAALDIMPNVPGLDFDEAWERRISGVVDEETGLYGHVICLQDFIASKLASGRLRDLGDVDDVQRAADAIRRAAKATAT